MSLAFVLSALVSMRVVAIASVIVAELCIRRGNSGFSLFLAVAAAIFWTAASLLEKAIVPFPDAETEEPSE